MKTSKHLAFDEEIWEGSVALARYLSFIEESKISANEVVRRSLRLYLSIYSKDLKNDLPPLEYKLGNEAKNTIKSIDADLSEVRQSRYSKTIK